MMMTQFDLFCYENNYDHGRCVLREGNNTIVLFETDKAYGKQIFPDAPEMVCQQFLYDAETLTLRSEGQFLKDFYIQIGVWKNYSPDGTVTDEIDQDKGYPLKWQELKGVLLANDIAIEDIQQLSRMKNEDKKPIWLVIMKTKQGVRETISIDAVNGDVLERVIRKIKNK